MPPPASPTPPKPPPAPTAPAAWTGMTHGDCAAVVDAAVEREPRVRFLVQKMAEAGCPVSRSFFKVEPCADAVGGGFRPPDGVVLCHNHLPRAVDVTQAMAHELIHAYDHCRAADLDWAALDHHACSEVRAASLSGDCSFANEVMRGHAGVRGQHQACARRRAALSVAMNPACVGGPREAEAAVDRVFDACFADTAPFDRIP